MISIEQCKKILNKGKRKYTDEEVKDIREFLYQIANIELDMRKELNDKIEEKIK